LGIQISTLRKRLNNYFSKKELYYENVDYIKIKSGNGNQTIYMLNYQCFENLAMTGDTEEANTVRLYFIKLREFIRDNQHFIYQAIENKKNNYTNFKKLKTKKYTKLILKLSL